MEIRYIVTIDTEENDDAFGTVLSKGEQLTNADNYVGQFVDCVDETVTFVQIERMVGEGASAIEKFQRFHQDKGNIFLV